MQCRQFVLVFRLAASLFWFVVCVFVRKCLKIEVKGKTRRQQHCAARGGVAWGWGVENAFNRWEML